MLRKIKKVFCSALWLVLVITVTVSALVPHKSPSVFSTAKSQEAVTTQGTEEVFYCPGGMSFGVRMETKGVLVVGFSRSSKGGECAAEKAGLSTKDVIEKINGKSVNTVAEVIGCIEGCGGNKVTLEVMRDGDTKTVSFLPEKDESGIYRAGIWVRDSTAGIGTVTLVNAKTGEFWGLGHGICDSDTGVLMPLLRGNVYDISVVSIRKGKAGAPGELKGYFSSALSGILMKNTAAGVYGRFSEYDASSLTPMPLANRQEVKEGDATILCTLTNGKVSEYSVRIVKITNPKGDAKNFIVEVTDPRLLEETGGIVQGMSGSTIIQNGKIVGAVTHVMVNDPTRGYGIFIENMLNATA
ncbi:MAG: SpoIVB peptidase [Clostridia bacterium]|nr:SpoIVB peptidase [Clostridia bacterium]